MDRYQRLLTLHRILKAARYPVALTRLMDELDCSRATVYRDVAFLRDALGAPIESTGEQATFHYAADAAGSFELPGLWLSSAELESLLAMHQLLARTGGEMLSGTLAPLRARIEQLLQHQNGGRRFPIERIRVTRSLSRQLDQAVFRSVAGAVLERHQLRFRYRARSTNQDSLRRVSPQRLTHYRENWYLDALDHDRDALRSFSLDRITQPTALSEPASDVADSELDVQLASAYGIFSGTAKSWATLRFSARAARWVAAEHWHSKQEGGFLPDGRYQLKVPYGNARELLMDVLRYGPDVEVVAPVALREEARIQLQLALHAYD